MESNRGMNSFVISENDKDSIDKFITTLIIPGLIQGIMIDFDETITVQGLQNGIPLETLSHQNDNDIRNNIRNPSFLSVLLRALNGLSIPVRVSIGSFQDELRTGYRKIRPSGGDNDDNFRYIIAGMPLVSRYVDALLGDIAPQNRRLLNMTTDFLLWDPTLRLPRSFSRQEIGKNGHIHAFRTNSGRLPSQYPPLLSEKQVLLFDDSETNVALANKHNAAIALHTRDGINADLLRRATTRVLEAHKQDSPAPKGVFGFNNTDTFPTFGNEFSFASGPGVNPFG